MLVRIHHVYLHYIKSYLIFYNIIIFCITYSTSIPLPPATPFKASLERRCGAHELRDAFGPGSAVVPGLAAGHRHQRRLCGADVGALRGLPAGAGDPKQTLGW